MDHAARVVERFAIDREPRMLSLAEHGHQLGDGHRFLHGDDVGARDHDVLDGELAEAERVEQHGALLAAEGVAVRRATGKRVLDHLAQVGLLAEPEAREQALEPGRLLLGQRIAGGRKLVVGERSVAHGDTSAGSACASSA